MIDRYKNWMINHGNETDSESESDADAANNSDDSDWNLTVKGSSPYIVDASNDDHNSKMMQSLSISESRHGHQRISWSYHMQLKFTNTARRGVADSECVTQPLKKSY